MLNKSTVEIGGNLAELLTERGVRLVPKANTLINALSAAIDHSDALRHTSYGSLDSVKIDIEAASLGTSLLDTKVYQSSEHDTYMDNYLDELANLISGHIDFARNVVNKEILKLTERVQHDVSSYRYRDAEDFFNVSYYKLPEVLNLDILGTEIPSYVADSRSIRQGYDVLNLRGLEEAEDFSKYLLTGVEEEDAAIVGWFKSLGPVGITYVTDHIDEFMLDIPSYINYTLVNYLFYRNLSTNTEAVTNESVPVVTRKAISNRDHFGACLAYGIGNYKAAIKSGKLTVPNSNVFSYFNTNQLDLIIYEESFAKLAEAGYGIESIFGYVASGNGTGSVTVDEIVKGDKEYLDRWSKTRSLYAIHMNSQRLDIFKHILSQAFDDSVSNPENVTDAEKEFYAKDSNFGKETVARANTFITEITVDELDCIEDLALKLVASIRFRFSNAHAILSEMKEMLAADDKLEPMEAALYSVVSYLTEFCLDQVEVVKFN